MGVDPSTKWILGIKLRLSGLVAGVSTAEPSYCPFLALDIPCHCCAIVSCSFLGVSGVLEFPTC